MLTKSNVKFFNDHKGIEIQFDVKNLDVTILESFLDKGTEVNFEINSEKLFLVNENDKSLIALLYNVGLLDARAGWLLREMCLTSQNFGFIISPMSRWHRRRIIDCYKAIKQNEYKSYFRFEELDKSVIYLVIDWSNFKNLIFYRNSFL